MLEAIPECEETEEEGEECEEREELEIPTEPGTWQKEGEDKAHPQGPRKDAHL